MSNKNPVIETKNLNNQKEFVMESKQKSGWHILWGQPYVWEQVSASNEEEALRKALEQWEASWKKIEYHFPLHEDKDCRFKASHIQREPTEEDPTYIVLVTGSLYSVIPPYFEEWLCLQHGGLKYIPELAEHKNYPPDCYGQLFIHWDMDFEELYEGDPLIEEELRHNGRFLSSTNLKKGDWKCHDNSYRSFEELAME